MYLIKTSFDGEQILLLVIKKLHTYNMKINASLMNS